MVLLFRGSLSSRGSQASVNLTRAALAWEGLSGSPGGTLVLLRPAVRLRLQGEAGSGTAGQGGETSHARRREAGRSGSNVESSCHFLGRHLQPGGPASQ